MYSGSRWPWVGNLDHLLRVGVEIDDQDPLRKRGRTGEHAHRTPADLQPIQAGIEKLDCFEGAVAKVQPAQLAGTRFGPQADDLVRAGEVVVPHPKRPLRSAEL